MESVVLITTVYPELIGWVLAISVFVSLAVTAIVSPNRRWFELAVIFQLLFVVNAVVVALIVQTIAGITLVEVEAIELLEAGSIN